ncbi:ribonuclease Z [Clostridium weizhouense]|uniref:Ribonuclease Z n=1 Tax=Clostridium weizhouense TaxID=2859781 RepID=A0ABS7AMM2_9CLOT|nr:ribonuclease Z [Clostridium weizhouense]MBW6409913.1 ribonuclease Z [Clostridium weizhouense]
MVDLCILGTLGGMPMIDRFMSSTLINVNGRKILIDCGEGTQVAMRKTGWGFKSLDIICITHSHGDHTVGLPGLLSTIGNSGRTEKLTIIGPPGITNIVNGLNVINPYLPYELNIVENTNDTINFHINNNNICLCENKNKSNFSLSSLELEHSTNCIGYSFYFKRKAKFSVEKAIKNNIPKALWNKLQNNETVIFENNKYYPYMVLDNERKGIKISYITDTRPTKNIPSFIKDSDLFICEGTYGNDIDIEKAIKNCHMTFSEAATLAKEGNCKELILTHFSPALSDPNNFLINATNIFEKSIIADDGLTKNLKYFN